MSIRKRARIGEVYTHTLIRNIPKMISRFKILCQEDTNQHVQT